MDLIGLIEGTDVLGVQAGVGEGADVHLLGQQQGGGTLVEVILLIGQVLNAVAIGGSRRKDGTANENCKDQIYQCDHQRSAPLRVKLVFDQIHKLSGAPVLLGSVYRFHANELAVVLRVIQTGEDLLGFIGLLSQGVELKGFHTGHGQITDGEG